MRVPAGQYQIGPRDSRIAVAIQPPLPGMGPIETKAPHVGISRVVRAPEHHRQRRVQHEVVVFAPVEAGREVDTAFVAGPNRGRRHSLRRRCVRCWRRRRYSRGRALDSRPTGANPDREGTRGHSFHHGAHSENWSEPGGREFSVAIRGRDERCTRAHGIARAIVDARSPPVTIVYFESFNWALASIFGIPNCPPRAASCARSIVPSMVTIVSSFGSAAMMDTPAT